MALPDPLPDNPLRWDGWKLYGSANAYERLCLDFSANPSNAQIETSCRQLLMWWQKKLPLKNQPSNPLSQLLRSGLDEAPAKLAEARTLLLDPESRAQIDKALLVAEKETALGEFDKFLDFVLADGALGAEEEENLYTVCEANLGLGRAEMQAIVDCELQKRGFQRIPAHNAPPPPAPEAPAQATPVAAPTAGPREEFLRMLRLSVLDEITDDQRDAFCNMGEALGLSGGDAEDLIDEYLEERMLAGTQAVRAAFPLAISKTAPPPVAAPQGPDLFAPVSPLQRAEEKRLHPNFSNSLGMEMLLVTTGSFEMGSVAPDAAPNERPVTLTQIPAFYLSRWTVTNAQYEAFDPTHRNRRAPGAGDRHPVVYVTRAEAGRFCEWLGNQERRTYRLPTEAEWEYAARGTDGRQFPWGNRLDSADRANFADANKRLPWSEASIDCGFDAASPVGSFPQGSSPFGLEDMAGNVWEWCEDCFSAYPGRQRSNPRGPIGGPRQIYRGGSWKSRITSLRTTSRGINSPAYSANDVGFRIACDCGR
ncbi:MAG: formylglycine-generating enzyme family protein [Chthoniobacteraceae bacterium]